MSDKVLIVTPGNDLDSLLSAAVIKHAFTGIGDSFDICFPSLHNKESMVEEVKRKCIACTNVIFTDFPLDKRSYMELSKYISSLGGEMYYIDHHRSSESLGGCDVHSVDFTKNCVQLAKEMMEDVLRIRLPAITRTLSCLSETGEFDGMHHLTAAVRRYIDGEDGTSMRTAFGRACVLLQGDTAGRKAWRDIYMSLPSVIEDHDREKRRIERSVVGRIITRIIGGAKVGVVSDDRNSAQSILNSMHDKKGLNCLLVYNVDPSDSMVHCTVRGIDDISTTAVSGAIRGNGHYKASHALMTIEDFSNIVLGVKPTVIQAPAPVVVTARSRKTTPSDTIVQEVVASVFKEKVEVPMQLVIDSCPRHRAIMKTLGKDKNAVVRCLYVIAVLQHKGNAGLAASTVHGFVEKNMTEILTYSGKQLKSDRLIKLATKMLPGGELDYLPQS